MADETTRGSVGPYTCHKDALYVVIAIAVIVGVACVMLILWIMRLKRRQNGYAPVRGNEDEVQKYKDFYEEKNKEKRHALQEVETFKVLLDEEKREVRKQKAMYEEEKGEKEDLQSYVSVTSKG
ncbi:uncharacterized protein LOC123557397 [Mercenaria mercenaria]|uniref:uncharacterized protein LOC123557397 n=1 Tax=Mercenaria mercenaria TaxID=6596 RepID=UPI00234F4696|nr:uncharacterized protein LOC123557397 [Mercenaria mercenaria]